MRAAALVAVCAVALARCGGSDSKPLLVGGKAAAVHGSLTPDVHLFGEPIVAQIDIIVDREKVDPDGVRVKTSFEPYNIVGPPETERQDIGGFTHLRYKTTLRCLTEDCIPRTLEGETSANQLPGLPPFLPGEQRDEKVKYQFPPAVVSAAAEPKDRTLGRVVWPPLRSLSRINWYDSSVVGQGFPFVATVTPLPEPDYRISPTLLGVSLIALAVALVAAPMGLVWRSRRRRRRPELERRPSLSPLQRALVLVEWASRRPSVDERREALEALAFELDVESVDGDPRAGDARKQGWSPPSPQPEGMTSLVASIREEADASES